MKLTLSVVQRHVRDLHVAVAAAVVLDVAAVPWNAAFSAIAQVNEPEKSRTVSSMVVVCSRFLPFVTR